MPKIQAWAAPAAKKPLAKIEYDPGPLDAEEVEVAVEQSHRAGCRLQVKVGHSRSPKR